MQIPQIPLSLKTSAPALISFVGRQPAAVAVTIASLQAQGIQLQQILLIASQDPMVQVHAQRLETWLQETCQIPDIQLHTIPNPGLQAHPAIQEHIQAWLQTLPDNQSSLIFAFQAGLVENAVYLSQELKSARLWLASTDHDCCHLRQASQWESPLHFPAAHLGLEPLLELVGLKATYQKTAPSRLPTLMKDLVTQSDLKSLKHLVYHFEAKPMNLPEKVFAAFEAYGKLYLLFEYHPENLHTRELQLLAQQNATLARQAQGQIRQANLDKLRQIAGTRYEGLMLQPAVLSEEEIHSRQWKLFQVPALGLPPAPVKKGHRQHRRDLEKARAKLVTWLKGEMAPHQQQAQHTLHQGLPQGSTSAQLTTPAHQSQHLAVYLGADPAVTLTSICSHRPEQVWLFYDRFTPKVVDLARNLPEVQALLGVKELHLIPDDLQGTEFGHWQQKQGQHLNGLRADLQPGSKEQSLALSLNMPDQQLWKFDLAQQISRPLQATNQTTQPLQTNLQALARVTGATKMEACVYPSHWPALQGPLLGLEITEVGGQSEVQINRGKQHPPLLLKLGYQNHAPTDMEILVAALFQRLNSPRFQIDELWSNLFWPLKSAQDPTADKGMMQIDLALRLQNWILSVECKSYPQWLSKKCESHAARSRACFGRLNTLPVVVVKKRRHPERLLKGCLLWDLADLLNPALIEADIQAEIVKRIRTH